MANEPIVLSVSLASRASADHTRRISLVVEGEEWAQREVVRKSTQLVWPMGLVPPEQPQAESETEPLLLYKDRTDQLQSLTVSMAPLQVQRCR